MQINLIRHRLILPQATLALLAMCFVQLPARIVYAGSIITSQLPNPNADDIVVLSSSFLGGLGRGQTMRFTLFNPSSPSLLLRADVKLFDAQGRVIAESPEAAIPPGEFRSFNFNRNDIPLEGERGTGRLQVRGTITVFEQRDTNGAIRNQFPTVIEVIDRVTGLGQIITTATAPYAPIIIAARPSRSPAKRENASCKRLG